MTRLLEESARATCSRYGNERTRLIDILRALQAEHRCVPLPARHVVADCLQIPPVDVASVVSFYSFLTEEPTGRFAIRMCHNIIDRIESLHLRGVETLSDEQLQPEWAVDFRGRRVVVIADADLGCEGPYRLRRITPDPFAPFSTHALPPAALAGLAQQLFHATPACYVLGMRPIDLTRFREGLSPGAMENLDAALSFLLPLLADAETLASAVEIGTERAAANR